ncbi:MAG: 30S ribosomal protein S5 [Candidatus Micrarchaeota archaeon]
MAKFKGRGKRRQFRREEEREEWFPKTRIGKMVMKKEILSIDQIFEMGKPIREHQIADYLIPTLTDHILSVSMTQRMTDCGRKIQFRAVAIVGDSSGHVGIGVGKADETRPAIERGIKNAKRNLISVPLGCGSWECGCGTRHTVPIKVAGHNGSVTVILKPAPRGVGIVSSDSVKKVLSLAGVKDAWTFSRGNTSNTYNTAMAVYYALDNLNRMKITGNWTEDEPAPEPVEITDEGAPKKSSEEKKESPKQEKKPEPIKQEKKELEKKDVTKGVEEKEPAGKEETKTEKVDKA